MLTKKDRQQLLADFKAVFATKDDLSSFATKDDLKKELKPLRQDIRKLKKDVSVIVKFFDRKSVSVEKDVKHIKEHLGL
ncbi:hypothetical protein C4579_01070, partial [Candidatus Microgenomates bacterium]